MRHPYDISTIDLGPDELNQLHRAQLDIAKRVKQVCDAQGLEYFLIAGTLLGAVRHGGFIPWDDDMDIGMPRDSYDRFLEVAPGALGPDFFVQTLETDPGYGLCFTKIRKNGTTLVESTSSEAKTHKGIFIDIFPYDNIPDRNWQRFFHAKVTLALKQALILKKGYTPWARRGKVSSSLHRLAAQITQALPTPLLKGSLNMTIRLFNCGETESLTAIGGSYGYEGESIKRQWIETLTTLNFEGVSFKCPENSHQYLTKLYGEYMTPPPLENRTSRHGISALNFGDSTS